MTEVQQLNTGEITSIHTDRLTIVGNIKRDREGYSPLFMKLLMNPYDTRLQVDPYYHHHMYDTRIGVKTEESTAYIELNKRKGAKGSDFRLDFNPAKCNEEDITFIKEILYYILDKRPTKIDMAIDFYHKDFSHYHIEDGRRRKTETIQGATGRLETQYRGSRAYADDYIKFYDKTKERLDKKWQKVDHEWFRLEETIRREKIQDWETYEWFNNIKLVPNQQIPIFPEEIKATTQSQAFSVIMGFQDIKVFSSGTQTKIREAIRSARFEGEVDVQEQIKKAPYKQMLDDAVQGIKSFLG